MLHLYFHSEYETLFYTRVVVIHPAGSGSNGRKIIPFILIKSRRQMPPAGTIDLLVDISLQAVFNFWQWRDNSCNSPMQQGFFHKRNLSQEAT